MSPRTCTIVILAGVVLVATMITWRLRQQRAVSTTEAKQPTTADVQARLQIAAADLIAASDAQAAGRKLAELRTTLLTLPAQAATTAIREVLQSNIDAPTRMDLAPGPGGVLEHAPSLRVFLLDYLAQVDPSAAAAEAERILREKSSQDDWAVALRNYARVHSSPEARAFLRQKFEEMARHEEWQKNPSSGFLQAFDLPVFLGGTELVPTLTELLAKKDNQAVAHAAYLALDRLVLRDPAVMLTELQRAPELMRGREITRANFFARANLSDAQQRDVVETYLLDPSRQPNELDTFAGLFPNRNLMLSYNLLTTASPPDAGPQMSYDRFALRVLDDWMDDPRFVKVRPQLTKMKARLESFVKR